MHCVPLHWRIDCLKRSEASCFCSGSELPTANGTAAHNTALSDNLAAMQPAAPRGRPYTVSIAIPGSVIDNTQTTELATAVAGQIARTAAIFKIDEVVVIDDAASKQEGTIGAGAAFLARVLQFMETPQYLRRCHRLQVSPPWHTCMHSLSSSLIYSLPRFCPTATEPHAGSGTT